MATASIYLSGGAIWGSCKASAVAPGGYTSHRNCSDGRTVTPFVATAQFLDRHRWRTRKSVPEILVSIRECTSPPLPHSLSLSLPSLLQTSQLGFLHFRHLVIGGIGKKVYPMHGSQIRTHKSPCSIHCIAMMDGCHKTGRNCTMPNNIDK